MIAAGGGLAACDPDDPCRGDFIHDKEKAVCIPLPPDDAGMEGMEAMEQQETAATAPPSAENLREVK